MTSPKPMRIEELLELAALDAYGLLEEYEAELYTRSFHHAPAAVQDEILRIQAEIAADTSLLPSVSPDTELRRKVLDAVARAIEEDARELAPLASIGQRFAINTPVDPAMSRSGLSAQLWRAAALVMVGVSIVLAYFGAEARNRAEEIAQLALRNNTGAYLEKHIGPTYKDYVGNPNCTPFYFTNRSATVKMLAAVHVNNKDQSAFLAVMGIATPPGSEPAVRQFRLRVVYEDGSREMLATFDSATSYYGQRIDSDPRLIAAVRWEIVDNDGNILLRTA